MTGGNAAPAGWRTLHEAEQDYLKDLLMRWTSYSYVAAGVGLVLGIIAASMHGYALPGFAVVSPRIADGLGLLFAGGGAVLCGMLQLVARRLRRDLALLRADLLEGPAVARPEAKYVNLTVVSIRLLVRRDAWDRARLPYGEFAARVEHTPVSRVVLTVNGSGVYS